MNAGRVGRELVAEERLVAGLTVRPPKLDLLHSTERTDDSIRGRGLRVDEELVRVAVIAAPVRVDLPAIRQRGDGHRAAAAAGSHRG